MGCGAKKPCACSHCGPFVISSKGQFRELSGEPMLDAPGADSALAGGMPPSSGLPSGWRGGSFGARLTKTWTPETDVGLPAVNAARYVPLGSGLSEDASGRAIGVSKGAGGSGIGVGESVEEGPLPIGTRPSVPARIGVNFERLGKAARPGLEPYGMMPLEAEEDAPIGSHTSPFYEPGGAGDLGGASGPLRLVQPLQQFVPPPPASQDYCIVNGFDPMWGQPPTTYKGVVVRFDPTHGAYEFNPRGKMREAFMNTGDDRLLRWFHEMEERFHSGYMLQPYMPEDGKGKWDFRWIPRRQEVICV